jgi:hypothetical protein
MALAGPADLQHELAVHGELEDLAGVFGVNSTEARRMRWPNKTMGLRE